MFVSQSDSNWDACSYEKMTTSALIFARGDRCSPKILAEIILQSETSTSLPLLRWTIEDRQVALKHSRTVLCFLVEFSPSS